MASTSIIRAPGGTSYNGGAEAWKRNGGGGGPSGAGRQNHRLGMCFALLAIAMLFIGLTSAYVVRQGLGEDWKALPMPGVLLLNTAVLLLSSATLEKARSEIGRGGRKQPGIWMQATFALGVAFLGGQWLAWRALAAQGVFLGTNPHSSFFYMLTGLHGAHVAGGLLALGWVCGAPGLRVKPLEVTALYWHFMGALWIYLLLLLFVWG